MLGAQGGEERLGQPEGEEALDPFVLDTLGELLVGGPAGGPGGLVLDPGSGAYEDEADDPVGVGQGEVQGGAAAHRVPGPERRPGHQAGQ